MQRILASSLCVLTLAAVTAKPGRAQPAAVKSIPGDHWVGTWAASAQDVEKQLQPPTPPGLADVTLRQVVRVSIGGPRLRVRFSNAFGAHNDGLKITAARIAVSAGGSAIKPGTDKPLTFDGQPSVMIPAGVLMVSDPVDFDLAPGSDLVVTIHVNSPESGITGHRSARAPYTYVQAGDAVAAPALLRAFSINVWYFLCGVDVLAPESSAAVVCLGDSIADGKGSTEGENRRWPDFLARRLQANPATAGIGVLNEGIGGNALWRGGIGQIALARLERDVLVQPGVRWLIVLEGINDLGGGKTSAAEIIASFEQIILRAHDRGLPVYGATIMPCGGSFYFKPELEEKRQAINQWIRTSHAFDAFIDLDAALRDPAEPNRLLKAADSGDHLHPSDEGHRMIADAIDLRLFEHH